MRIDWIPVVLLFSIALGSCGGLQTRTGQAPSPAPKDTGTISEVTAAAPGLPPAAAPARPSPIATAAVAPSTVPVSGAWKSYDNRQAGYHAEVPQDWSVNESAGLHGMVITSFTAPSGGPGIVVTVQSGETSAEEIPDLPNTRCRPVTIGAYPGRRCLDTIAGSVSTIFSAHGKQYSIGTSGKGLDPTIYQIFLDRFGVTP